MLVGDGPEREALSQLAARRGVCVEFRGECYDEDTLRVLTSNACATVSPGKVGLTAMQSLAYGTPVITHGDLDSQMPEVEVVLPGTNGDFFVKGSVESLATTINNWAAYKGDRSELARTCIESLVPFYTAEWQAAEIERAALGLLPRVP